MIDGRRWTLRQKSPSGQASDRRGAPQGSRCVESSNREALAQNHAAAEESDPRDTT